MFIFRTTGFNSIRALAARLSLPYSINKVQDRADRMYDSIFPYKIAFVKSVYHVRKHHCQYIYLQYIHINFLW